MDLLLDTHVLIWSQQEPERLGNHCKTALLSTGVARRFHTISALEIARLAAAGRLQFRKSPRVWIDQALAALLAETIELSQDDALGAYALPGNFHKDPCDRILVAAARNRGLKLVTADARMLDYPHVATIDASQ